LRNTPIEIPFSVMKILLYLFGGALLLVALFVAYVVVSMAFLPQITDLKLRFKRRWQNRAPTLVTATEGALLPPDAELPGEPLSDATCIGKRVWKGPDGTLRAEPDSDGGSSAVAVLQCDPLGAEIAVVDNDGIYAFSGGVLGNRLAPYDANASGPASELMAVGGGRFLLMSHFTAARPTLLWQYDLQQLSNPILLVEEPYYFFIRHPRLLDLGDGARALVYYWGAASYAFGGDASRPMYSAVRLYSREHPGGIDLIETTFRLGVITDLRRDGEELVAVVDPTSPRHREPQPRATLRLKLAQ
jgi:hypothetical protein